MNEHNALLKKSRMTRYFIDAVITLSDDIPVDAITLRQVAAAAGYNSATLYNYFQNMNQLIAFTLIDRMSRIWIDASKLQGQLDGSLNHYLGQWLAQCRESFQHPQLFLYFFQLEEKAQIYQRIPDYFAVFPEIREQLSPGLLAQTEETDFARKNQNILLPCVTEGYFLSVDVENLIAAADILFGGILLQSCAIAQIPRPRSTTRRSSSVSCIRSLMLIGKNQVRKVTSYMNRSNAGILLFPFLIPF